MDDPELEAIRAKKRQELLAGSLERNAATDSVAIPILLTDATFDGEVRKHPVLLVDFWADWCGPCHAVARVLDRVAKERIGSMRLAKLNIDENPRTTQRFGVMSIPTMLLFKDGKLVDGVVGAVPKPEIEAVLDRWA